MKTVLNDGFVRLDACEATDLSVVNAARVSFGKLETEMNERNEGLIRFLMRERHGTPFEHNMFRFHVRIPIFVAREWMRHRAGWSYNEFSGRYSEMDPAWYEPSHDDVRQQVGKPGAYTFDPVDHDVAVEAANLIHDAGARAFREYNFLLSRGVAKELARVILPLGSYTEMYATCNARSLMHFLSLRNTDTAQREIQMVAAALEEYFVEKMPVTARCFVEHERIAP